MRANSHVRTDRRAVLVDAVIIGRDRAGTDVRLFADLGVANVAEVRHLRPAADARVLGLDKRADLAVLAEVSTGTQVGERTNGCVPANHGERRVGALNGCALTDLAVEEGGIRPDDRVALDHRRAPDLRAGENLDVFRNGRLEVDPGGRGILDRDSGELPAANDAGVEFRRGRAELGAIVDAGDEPPV